MSILPKSLHTVTVLYRVALDQFERDTSQSAVSCVAAALDVLGYDYVSAGLRMATDVRHDPHALARSALNKLLATYPTMFAAQEES